LGLADFFVKRLPSKEKAFLIPEILFAVRKINVILSAVYEKVRRRYIDFSNLFPFRRMQKRKPNIAEKIQLQHELFFGT